MTTSLPNYWSKCPSARQRACNLCNSLSAELLQRTTIWLPSKTDRTIFCKADDASSLVMALLQASMCDGNHFTSDKQFVLLSANTLKKSSTDFVPFTVSLVLNRMPVVKCARRKSFFVLFLTPFRVITHQKSLYER